MEREGDERTYRIIGAAMDVPDFLVGEIVVEIKAHSALSAIDVAQTLNSMECAKVHIGLLVNFGEPSLKWKRLIL